MTYNLIQVHTLQNIDTTLTLLNKQLTKLNSTHFDLNTAITAGAGLLGVVIGAFISYFFTKKISDSTQKIRIVIQRKNLIYSKLYKELKSFKDNLEKIPNNQFYIEIDSTCINDYPRYRDGFYIRGSMYIKPVFDLWLEMKKDIRHIYVPSDIKNYLDALEKAILSYHENINKFKTESKPIEKNIRQE